MNSMQIAELQAEQGEILCRIYALTSALRHDPLDSFKKHDLDIERAHYKQTTADIQLLHPMGADCPADICDADLACFYSDLHKDAYGLRYRGDKSVAAMRADIPELEFWIKRTSPEEQDFLDQLQAREDQDYQESLEEAEINRAYRTDYDHHDPRIANRLPTGQRFAVLTLCM